MTVLVSCSKALLTHDLDDPQPAISMTPHKGTINCSVWSHNNQVIASCGSDGKIILTHAGRGSTLLSLDDDTQKPTPVNSVSFTSNSLYLASGGQDGILKIWDLKKRNLSSSHKYHFSSITSVHWSLDDSIVASSSLTGDIVLHSTKFGTQIGNFTQKGSQGVKMIKFSPFMTNSLASAGIDGSVYVWDINTRQPSATFLSNHASRVNAISFSSFNPVLMCSAGLDKNVNFYDIRERKVVKTLQSDAPLTALGFHNDGHTIVTGTLHGGLYVYDLKSSGTVKTYLKGHDDTQVNFVDFVRPEDSKMVETSLLEEEKPREMSSTSSVNSTYEKLTQKPSAEGRSLTGKILGNEPPSATQRNSFTKTQEEPPKSVLDPNNELTRKFGNFEEFRKQTLDSMNARKAEKDLNNSRLSGLSNTSMQQADVKNDIPSNLSNLTERILASGGGLASKVLANVPNVVKEKAPEPMQVEYSNLGNLNKSITETLDNKTASYVNKVDSARDFTPQQKEFIKDCLKEQKETFKECLYDLQSNMVDNVANLHLEVIRQFEIQKNEIDAKLDKYFTEFNALFQRHEELRRDNERLKKTSY